MDPREDSERMHLNHMESFRIIRVAVARRPARSRYTQYIAHARDVIG